MSLIFRKDHAKHRSSEVPADFIRQVSDLFNKQFTKERGEASFSVIGSIYPNELVVCVSLMKVGELRAASCLLSVDLSSQEMERPSKVTKKLSSCVDLAASWFNQTMENCQGNGLDKAVTEIAKHQAKWEEVEWDSGKIFVQLNKDNQTLDKAADRFLSESGFDPEGDNSDN